MYQFQSFLVVTLHSLLLCIRCAHISAAVESVYAAVPAGMEYTGVRPPPVGTHRQLC